jgi:hypothetical protein
MDSEPRAALSSGDGMHRVVALPAFERRRPVVVASRRELGRMPGRCWARRRTNRLPLGNDRLTVDHE